MGNEKAWGKAIFSTLFYAVLSTRPKLACEQALHSMWRAKRAAQKNTWLLAAPPLWRTCSRDRWIPVFYEWTNIRVHECRRALVHETEQNDKYMKVLYLEVNQQRNYCLASSMISNRLHFNLVLENEWSSINEKGLVIFKLIDAVMSSLIDISVYVVVVINRFPSRFVRFYVIQLMRF